MQLVRDILFVLFLNYPHLLNLFLRFLYFHVKFSGVSNIFNVHHQNLIKHNEYSLKLYTLIKDIDNEKCSKYGKKHNSCLF